MTLAEPPDADRVRVRSEEPEETDLWDKFAGGSLLAAFVELGRARVVVFVSNFGFLVYPEAILFGWSFFFRPRKGYNFLRVKV